VAAAHESNLAVVALRAEGVQGGPCGSAEKARCAVGRSRSGTFWRLITGTGAAVLIVLFAGSEAFGQRPHRCALPATEQARKLLTFHLGSDSRIEIDPAVKQLPAIRNPANRRQLFDVLEVWGTVYKAQYRMRLIYARLPNECVLMGQEILESSSL
jgi:hypothetical protein